MRSVAASFGRFECCGHFIRHWSKPYDVVIGDGWAMEIMHLRTLISLLFVD